jgi:S-DNA-T family DNA segregation ATPase FtsK/SpoIIIE
MVYDEESLKLELKALVSELERRKAVFRANECSNIDEYNNNTGDNLRRIIFACDEVAELLDTSGLSKEHKASIEEISGYIATIARQGRAFGINLVLATQRPDATVLPGQIKNNIDFRACGRADKVLSRIILDDDSAAEKISKDAQGRFLTNDGTLFQAYMFDDRRRSL